MFVQDPLADRFPNQRIQQPPEGVFALYGKCKERRHGRRKVQECSKNGFYEEETCEEN